MDILYAVVVVIGLCIFESIASIDNAILNADILSTMGDKARRWFLIWGILIAVFLVRGFLPWIIIWASSPEIGFIDALLVTFTDNSAAVSAMDATAPYLLMFGGVFMAFLFLHWLFAEKKCCLVPGERFLTEQAPWFYAIAAGMLLVIVWLSLENDPYLAFAAVAGSTLFFIMHGFRITADKKSAELGMSAKSDMSKLALLLVIDATFSIDGVIGAFAFTFSVPLIFIGCGIGAIIVRELTIRNIENIKRYVYLKNGAMYAILFLSGIMVLEGFQIHVPIWIAPLAMVVIVGAFWFASVVRLRGDEGKTIPPLT
ncbi:MAG: DUF475 domain-containing protein [Methanocorpusculum sp.]|nr:DUF475 domain-containing protein [Methanocorpusculum sp.]